MRVSCSPGLGLAMVLLFFSRATEVQTVHRAWAFAEVMIQNVNTRNTRDSALEVGEKGKQENLPVITLKI